ncbi:MAG TPA: hypothetical protein VLU73_14515 [Methylococcaceae bacterium]|nr:hypothetical protein [Methylococcaceae bacterium]
MIALLLASLHTTTDLVLGKMGEQVIAWGVTYLLSLPYLWAVGSSGQNLAEAIGYLALFGTPVVVGFDFYALGLSACFGNVRAALLTALITLMLLASPLLLGPGLRQTVIGKAFDAVNPFAAALNNYDSVVIDSQPFGLQIGRLVVALIWLALTLRLARRSVRAIEI